MERECVTIAVKPPPKFKYIYYPKRFKFYWGGRGAGKNWNFSDALIMRGAQERLKIVCGRQFQNSIEDSVKTDLEASIVRLGLESEYKITNKKIIHRYTKTVFTFKGLERNVLSIKGWSDVDILWIDEANVLKPYVLEILLPTIRKKGSEIWFSMNRGSRSDPIDKMFLSKNIPDEIKDNAYIINVNWQDNPYFTEELELERQICLKTQPERYAHIWEGEPDDKSGAFKVLAYDKLLKCIDAHIKLNYKPSGMTYSGLDVADEGNDTNSWACRKAALLKIVREWKVKYLHMTASKADFLNKENNVVSMHYDAGGLGAGIKSDLSRIKKNPQTGAGPGIKRFIPFLFNGKVKGPARFFIKHRQLKVKNKDYFANAASQAWWNIRLRMENTIKALDGEKVDLNKCFFISGSIEDVEGLLSELNQAIYDDSSGKIKVDKAPEDAVSPNKADSVIMAYATDIKKGLRAA